MTAGQLGTMAAVLAGLSALGGPALLGCNRTPSTEQPFLAAAGFTPKTPTAAPEPDATHRALTDAGGTDAPDAHAAEVGPDAETVADADGPPEAVDGARSADAAEDVSPDVAAGIPPLQLAAVPPDAARLANELNTRAVALHERRRLEDAIPLYEQALRVSPAHTLARYNLACALARTGRTAEALALLAEFREADCPECRARLARARKDRDFAALWKDPDFRAVTDVKRPPKVDPARATAQRVAPRGLRKSSFEGAFADGAEVDVVVRTTDDAGHCREVLKRFDDQDALVRYLDTVASGWVETTGSAETVADLPYGLWPFAAALAKCERACCVAEAPCAGPLAPPTLLSLCFRMTGRGATVPSSLHLADCTAGCGI